MREASGQDNEGARGQDARTVRDAIAIAKKRVLNHSHRLTSLTDRVEKHHGFLRRSIARGKAEMLDINRVEF